MLHHCCELARQGPDGPFGCTAWHLYSSQSQRGSFTTAVDLQGQCWGWRGPGRQPTNDQVSTCTRVRPFGFTTHDTTNSTSKHDYLQSAMLHKGTMMMGSYAIIAMRTRGCASQCRIQPCKTPNSRPQRTSHAQLPRWQQRQRHDTCFSKKEKKTPPEPTQKNQKKTRPRPEALREHSNHPRDLT